MHRVSVLAGVVVSAAGLAAAVGRTPEDLHVQVSLDSAEQSGTATADVRMHARREVVWSLITSCDEAMRLIPGLVVCQVIDTAADRSWQDLHHVLDYSWYLPTLSYDVRVRYMPPTRLSVERTSGDLRTLRVTWTLQGDGEYTIAHYAVELDPGFWVPQWLVRSALRRDLPKMLSGLRARAEDVQRGTLP